MFVALNARSTKVYRPLWLPFEYPKLPPILRTIRD